MRHDRLRKNGRSCSLTSRMGFARTSGYKRQNPDSTMNRFTPSQPIAELVLAVLTANASIRPAPGRGPQNQKITLWWRMTHRHATPRSASMYGSRAAAAAGKGSALDDIGEPPLHALESVGAGHEHGHGA